MRAQVDKFELRERAREKHNRKPHKRGIPPTCTAGGVGQDCTNDQAAMAKRAAFQFHGNNSAMRLAG
jgi:hypothetical protein